MKLIKALGLLVLAMAKPPRYNPAKSVAVDWCT